MSQAEKTNGQAVNGHATVPRKQLADYLLALPRRDRRVSATYDAANDPDELKNYWANADSYDADSANSRAVRAKMVPRSRYEVANNGYADGIASTYANDVVGTGPKLRMQTGSTGFNQMVEAEWQRWCKAVQFRRKLWTMAHAKHTDGEAIGVMRTNPRVRHPVKLDLVLYETEQMQTPLLPFNDSNYIDGIKFGQFGNPEWYDILRQHPGSSQGFSRLTMTPDRVRPEFVLHWFLMRRPGQHRGVPESASTLNVGAAARRWREAVLVAAETAADFTMFMKTNAQGDTADPVDPMSTLDIQKRMMMALPKGWDPLQMKAEHPNSTFEMFHKALVNEQARPKSMPYNKAACDSSSYNYASGRLDHQTYYGALDVDREDGNDLVLDPLFDLWFAEAIRVFGWLGGEPNAIGRGALSHAWDWPKHRVADLKSEAESNDKRLRNGSLSLSKLYSDAGEDFQDEIQAMATDYGVTVDEMRGILLRQVYGAAVASQPAATDADADGASADEIDTAMASLKVQMDTYGIGVRSGSITPQLSDEEHFRSAVGLPPLSDEARKAWATDKGARRPVTLAVPGAGAATPQLPGSEPPDGSADETEEAANAAA